MYTMSEKMCDIVNQLKRSLGPQYVIQDRAGRYTLMVSEKEIVLTLYYLKVECLVFGLDTKVMQHNGRDVTLSWLSLFLQKLAFIQRDLKTGQARVSPQPLVHRKPPAILAA